MASVINCVLILVWNEAVDAELCVDWQGLSCDSGGSWRAECSNR